MKICIAGYINVLFNDGNKLCGKIAGLFVFMLFVCCASEGSFSSDVLDNYVIDNQNVSAVKIVPRSKNVKLVTLAKDVALKTGYSLEDFILIGEDLLIVDRDRSEVNCISDGGDILWSPIPPKPGQDRYSVIGGVRVDKVNKELYIEDMRRAKIDVFDLEGNYIRSIEKGGTFFDWLILGKDKVLRS